jgi:hypothetical protein
MPPLATLTRVADVLLDIRRDISHLDDQSLSASVDLALLLVGRRLAARLSREDPPLATSEVRSFGRKSEATGRRSNTGPGLRRLRR